MAIAVIPSGKALGADVEGIDCSQPLAKEIVDQVKRAWADNLVLRFRGQNLTDEQLMNFSANFGVLDKAPIAAAKRDQAKETGYVGIISNIKVNGIVIGALGHYESLWHTDMSYNDEPPIASLLYSIEIPPTGGDTGFANQYIAYELLPEATKERIAKLRLKHDSSLNSVGELRRGFREVTDPREAPGAVHPIVRKHPVTGKSALYLGRRRNGYIIGLLLAESEMLLDELWTAATADDFTWYQQWRVGDLIMWDNRCTLHCRDAFDESSHRLMHRTQITGERVLAT
jgi:alpha-ketoglutarate-dependent taurine dioxygenase